MSYWLSTLANKAEGTRVKYVQLFGNFLEFLQLEPDEIVRSRKEDLSCGDVRARRRFENEYLRFDAWLRGRGLSVSVRLSAFMSISRFFSAHELDLRVNKADMPKGESEETRASSKEEIRKLMAVVGPRERAIIMLAKDTGLGVSEMSALNCDLDLESAFPMLSMIRKKTRIWIKTFLGPECQSAIKAYLDYRRAGTQKIFPEALGPGSPRFRKARATVERMDGNDMSTMISMQAKSAGIDDLSPHCFRRFFETSLEPAGIPGAWIDRMMGHKPPSSRRAYSKPTDEQLREAYVKGYPALSVESRTDSEKLQQLEKKVDSKDEIIEALLRKGYDKDLEIRELRDRQDTLSRKLDQILDGIGERR